MPEIWESLDILQEDAISKVDQPISKDKQQQSRQHKWWQRKEQTVDKPTGNSSNNC